MGAAAVPALLALIDVDREAEDFGLPRARVVVHAIDLLTDLRAPEAIGPMLQLIELTPWHAVVHDRAVTRLVEYGAAALEAVLAAARDAADDEHHDSYCGVLARLGVRDERIWTELRRCFERVPGLGALMFADYGDRRALPLIEGAIEALVRAESDETTALDIKDLVDCYEDLGGVLPEEISAHLDEVFAQDGPAPPAAKVGRNDACPCGSGKKYKRCCLKTA